jgi:hypothetical protein
VGIVVSVLVDRHRARRRELELRAATNAQLHRDLAACIEQHPAGTEIKGLPKGERLLFALPDVLLIEPRAEHRGGPKVPTAVDRGTALFTDRALRFSGSTSETWKWANLLAVQSESDYLTLAVSNRQKVSGVGTDDGRHWAVELATNWAQSVHDGETLAPIREALDLPFTSSGQGAACDQAIPLDTPTSISTDCSPPAPSDIASQRRAEMQRLADAMRAVVARQSNTLDPYRAWEAANGLPPASTATPQQVRNGIADIVRVEGPVLQGRAHTQYVRSAGGARVGPAIRRVLEQETEALVSLGRLIAEDPLDDGSLEARTLRLPDQPNVLLRARGQRTLHEIPPAEIAALATRLRQPGDDDPALQRRILDTYGLSRLTEATRARLDACIQHSRGK